MLKVQRFKFSQLYRGKIVAKRTFFCQISHDYGHDLLRNYFATRISQQNCSYYLLRLVLWQLRIFFATFYIREATFFISQHFQICYEIFVATSQLQPIFLLVNSFIESIKLLSLKTSTIYLSGKQQFNVTIIKL